MSAQRFGAIFVDDSNADVWQVLMTGSLNFDKTAMISFCNQSVMASTASLAYSLDSLAAEPSQADIIVFNRVVPPGETFYHPALAVSENARIFVKSGLAGMSILAHGYRDDI